MPPNRQCSCCLLSTCQVESRYGHHSSSSVCRQCLAVLSCSLLQRRRNADDELNMRFVYEEGDLIAAEVQQLHAEGSIVLHTRSHKYGKVPLVLHHAQRAQLGSTSS